MDLSEHPLLDSAWATQANELFTDELRDLTELEASEEAIFADELRRLRERHLEDLPAPTPRPRSDASSDVERRSPPRGKRRSASRRGVGAAKPPSVAVGSGAKAAAARDAARQLREHEAFLTEARERRPWRVAMAKEREQLQQLRVEADGRRAAARHQMRFFVARGTDDYTMEEVLRGATAEMTGKRSVEITLEGMREGGGSETGGQCPYVIDALEFARALNEGFETAYGFCPLPRTAEGSVTTNRASLMTPAHAGGTAATSVTAYGATGDGITTAASTDELMEKLRLHEPGEGTELTNGLFGRTAVALPPVRYAESSSRKHEMSSRTMATTVLLPAVVSSAHSVQSTGTAAGTATATDASASASAAGGDAVSVATTRAHTSTRRERYKATGVQSTKSTSVIVPKIECSAPDGRVQLRSSAGVETSAIVRFVNRGAEMLRVRVRPSNHAWVTYSIVDSSFGIPSALRSTNSRGTKGKKEATTTSETTPHVTAPDGPLRCGGFIDVRITFLPLTTTEPLISTLLQIGYCRELNSRSGEGAKWGFYDVTVKCETALPSFRLLPAEAPMAENALEVCEFPCTLVMSSVARRFKLENMGSNAVITLQSSSPYFLVEPITPVLLHCGDRLDVIIRFVSFIETQCDNEELYLAVRDTEDGPIVAEHRFGLRGEAVLPTVELVRLGPLELQKGDSTPQLLVPGTAPGVCTNVEVILHNATPLAAPFYWRTDVVGGMKLIIEPSRGIFAPHQDTVFCVQMQPNAAAPTAAALNLFLEGLPLPTPDASSVSSPMGVKTVATSTTGAMSQADSEAAAAAVDRYSRKKDILALPDHNRVDLTTDPYGVFTHCTRVQPDDCEGVFATGFYLFADPTMPSLLLIPDCLEEGVECLIHCENVRRVTLQNDSPRPLHFCFDPSPSECPSDVILTPATVRDCDGVELKFLPRVGQIPPHASTNVTVCFTLRSPGLHAVVVDCFIPELVELLEPTRRRCTHQLQLTAAGVGPTVRTSAEFLDFGLIELGAEAEASFTVTNDNPIPVVFDLQDPMMREPPRFVFLPPSFRLGAGDSVEVTVYRQGIETGDAQTFFELVVQYGGVVAIETRATIQTPSLRLHDAVVSFGEVPEGVWVESSFTLSNKSAFDIPYTVQLAVSPPSIQVEIPPAAVARAGHCDICVPLRCAFQLYKGPDGYEDPRGYEAVLRLTSLRTTQDFLLEIRCDHVVQLAVALDLISVPRALAGAATAMAYASPILPSLMPNPPTMEIAQFISTLLWNLVTQRVVCDTTVTPIRPYCPPMELRADLPDGEPVWLELLGLRVSNQTGCESHYSVSAIQYATSSEREAQIADMGLPGGDKPSFWCRSVDGSERRERARRAALVSAQRRLLDGRGCATVLGMGRLGPLQPHAAPEVPLALFANLPGRYEETLRVHCGSLPPANIAVALELHGKPVLLDSTTAGLTMIDGKETLMMPSAIAGIGSSRRSIFLLNRVPRDLEVSARAFLTPSSFSVVAILEKDTEGESGAEIVRLRLQPVSTGAQERESAGKGHVTALPSKFLLPSMTSREVVIEYFPDAAFAPADSDGSTVREWRGGVIITADIADTPFNEAFIMDEFYRLHADRYPIRRLLQSRRSGEPQWAASVVRPIALLSVQQPMLTRDGVIARNEIISATPSEVAAMRRSATSSKSHSYAQSVRSNRNQIDNKSKDKNGSNDDSKNNKDIGDEEHTHKNRETDGGNANVHSLDNGDKREYGYNDDDDEDEDEEEEEDEAAGLGSWLLCRPGMNAPPLRPVEELFAAEREREELRAFLARRRLEVITYSRRCFVPIELEVRARCGAAQLAVEPSSGALRFPPFLAGRRCRQSLRLTNENCATLEFTLELPTQGFHLVSTELRESDGDGASSVGECPSTSATSRANAEEGREDSGRFRLRPHDALDVALDFEPSGTGSVPSHLNGNAGETVEGVLRVCFRPSCAGRAIQEAVELHQCIPLVVSFMMPAVRCAPEKLQFIPGQLLHDGRPQPSYPQKLKLLSSYPFDVKFEIVPSRGRERVSLVSGTSNSNAARGNSSRLNSYVSQSKSGLKPTHKGNKDLLTREREIHEVVHYWEDNHVSSSMTLDEMRPPQVSKVDPPNPLIVEDASRFIITPPSGVIPAATLGGQPGCTEVAIEFKEYSNVRFEASFIVLLNGNPSNGGTFSVTGESRATEL